MSECFTSNSVLELNHSGINALNRWLYFNFENWDVKFYLINSWFYKLKLKEMFEVRYEGKSFVTVWKERKMSLSSKGTKEIESFVHMIKE